MARYYDDIYFTNCNGELHLHLDGPTGTDETANTAAYFRVIITGIEPVYATGYTGNGCSDGWITSFNYEYSDQFQLSNSDDLDLVFDLNDSGSNPGVYYDTDGGAGGNFFTTGGHSDCLENNWWKDGLRLKGAGATGGFIPTVTIKYYDITDQQVGSGHDVGTNKSADRVTGQVYIYNAPSGTTRALIDDDNTSRSGTDYGVTNQPLQTMATTSGCSGDPHVTTFGGCKYTL